MVTFAWVIVHSEDEYFTDCQIKLCSIVQRHIFTKKPYSIMLVSNFGNVLRLYCVVVSLHSVQVNAWYCIYHRYPYDLFPSPLKRVSVPPKQYAYKLFTLERHQPILQFGCNNCSWNASDFKFKLLVSFKPRVRIS